MPESHSKTTAPDNRDLLALARAWAIRYYPGCPLESITIRLQNVNCEICLPAIPLQTFVPTTFQKAILAALNGKALTADKLGDAVKDRSRLYKGNHSLKELREQGLVEHREGVGFFRPDAPPSD